MRRALGACAWGGETRCGERKRMRQNEGRQVTSSFYTSPFKAAQASSGAMTAMSGQITITAIRGINLAAKDVGGSSDPYYILKCAAPHYRSSVCALRSFHACSLLVCYATLWLL